MSDGQILRTESLSKYFGALKAVDGVDLCVRKGEIPSIIGPNGAGKTTLFNLLTGFAGPTAGRILFNAKEITGLPPHQICKRGIGRSFQIFNIFADLSVLENVRLAIQSGTHINYCFWRSVGKTGALEEKAMQVLAQVGLQEKAGLVARPSRTAKSGFWISASASRPILTFSSSMSLCRASRATKSKQSPA